MTIAFVTGNPSLELYYWEYLSKNFIDMEYNENVSFGEPARIVSAGQNSSMVMAFT